METTNNLAVPSTSIPSQLVRVSYYENSFREIGVVEAVAAQTSSTSSRSVRLPSPENASPYMCEKADKGIQVLEDQHSVTASNIFAPARRSRKRKMETSVRISDPSKTNRIKGKKQEPNDELWPHHIETAFLEILIEWKSRNGKWSGGRFVPGTWVDIAKDLSLQIGRQYTTDQISGKFNRMRKQWRTMHWMINASGHTGVGWDSELHTIKASKEQWQDMINRRSGAAAFQRHGLPNYELMTEVFHDSGAQGDLSRSNNMKSMTDDQEKEALRKHVLGKSKASGHAPNTGDSDSIEEIDFSQGFGCNMSSGSKRKGVAAGGYGSRHGVDSKLAEQRCWEAWERESLSKAAKYEAQKSAIAAAANVSQPEKYSVHSCMEILNNEFPDLPPIKRLQASKFFQNRAYCETWVELRPEDRDLLERMDIQHLLYDSTSSSDDEKLDRLRKINAMTSAMPMRSFGKQPCRTSVLRGPMWLDELLKGHPIRMYECLGVRKKPFLELCRLLVERGEWVNRQQQRVDVRESLAIFLHCVTRNNKHTDLAERFQHSTETCDRHVKIMARMLVNLASNIIRPISEDTVHPSILHDPTKYPYFKDCIGAIDGTCIAAAAPSKNRENYRTRKNSIAQNVLAAVDHDMRFVFVHAGWEGSAHDSRVFLDAILRHELQFPWPTDKGKYYVVDSGYPNQPGFMAPYKGVRYHRSQFSGNYTFHGQKELFNHRHSCVRNVVERTFAALKRRFPMFKEGMPPYKPTRQIDLVIACCVIHNFVRAHDTADPHFIASEGPSAIPNCNVGNETPIDAFSDQPSSSREDNQRWARKRDEISNALWSAYCT